jgi:hypothetical protein
VTEPAKLGAFFCTKCGDRMATAKGTAAYEPPPSGGGAAKLTFSLMPLSPAVAVLHWVLSPPCKGNLSCDFRADYKLPERG